MNKRVIENIFIFMLIGIVICLLFPVIQRIVFNSQLSSIESSVESSMKSIKLLYFRENVNQVVELPLTVEYNSESYKIYSGSNEYKFSEKLENSGRKPIGGKIIIHENGDMSVVNLKYPTYTCSKPPNGEVSCERNKN